MKVFSVCGITRSGKTTTIEKILEGLTTRGYRVGAIKDIPFSNFTLDADPGSNTRRYRNAGAVLVAARSGEETDLLFPGRLPVEKLLRLFQDECDYLVLEGAEDLAVPKIVTAHTQEDLAAKWTGKPFCVSGRISSKIEGYRGKPAINVLDRTEDMLDLIESVCTEWVPESPVPSTNN